MKYNYAFVTLFVLFLVCSPGFAQQEFTLHLLDKVYQSTHTNPAFRARNKISISLFSSYHASFKNSGFTYNHLAANIEEDETGERIIDLEKLHENLNLNGRDYFHGSFNADLFALSLPAGRNRFSLNITEHVQARQQYDASILEIAAFGNEPGQTFQLGNYETDYIHYREFGIGWNRPFLEEDKLVTGARLKAVFGMSNIRTQHADVSFRTGTEEELYVLETFANVQANSSGMDLMEDDAGTYLLNTGNAGFGIDLGGTYELNDQISFAASVVNLGMISWKENSKVHTLDGAYTFSGIQNDDLLTDGFDINVDQLTDSIADTYKFDEEEAKYVTGLPTQVYLTGNYQLATRTTASATLYSDFYQSFRRGLALGIRQDVGRWLQAAATYSMQSRSYNNLGLGLAMTTGPKGVQVYMAADNMLGLVNVGNTKVFNARVGLNLVF